MRLIKSTIYDVRHFFFILVILLLAFGNALMVLNEGRFEEQSLVQEIFGFAPLDVFMNQYMLALGEFDLENIRL